MVINRVTDLVNLVFFSVILISNTSLSLRMHASRGEVLDLFLPLTTSKYFPYFKNNQI